jgi:hypothetical protein
MLNCIQIEFAAFAWLLPKNAFKGVYNPTILTCGEKNVYNSRVLLYVGVCKNESVLLNGDRN